jgi:hypothetical protein
MKARSFRKNRCPRIKSGGRLFPDHALVDDVNLHLGNALIDHSYPFSGR